MHLGLCVCLPVTRSSTAATVVSSKLGAFRILAHRVHSDSRERSQGVWSQQSPTSATAQTEPLCCATATKFHVQFARTSLGHTATRVSMCQCGSHVALPVPAPSSSLGASRGRWDLDASACLMLAQSMRSWPGRTYKYSQMRA